MPSSLLVVGSRPALIGNKLANRYHSSTAGATGPQYFEIDVDISSSSVANTIVNLVKGSLKALIIDLAVLFEGKRADELPEQLLGTVRFNHLTLGCAKRLPE